MNHELLEFICKSQATISKTPIKLFFESNLVQSFHPYDNTLEFDLTVPYVDKLLGTKQPMNYCVTTDLLIIGMVKTKATPYSIVIGPMSIGKVSETTARKIITSGKYPLKLDQISDLYNYLHMLPNAHLGQFISILALLYANINHEIISVDDVIKPDAEYDIEKEVESNMLEQDEKTSFQGIQRRNPYEFEQEMFFCIRHGLTSRLKSLATTARITETGILANDPLRNTKNAIIILNSLSLRAAIAGGLNKETAYQLGTIYIQKTEACIDLKQLSAISHTLRLDYCERVREIHFPHYNDQTILKALHYINENVHNKISATEIADMLGISKIYLSTRFNIVTGRSLPDYINQQKILEAKRLLIITDKPLSEISEYLSFSSQSYFQNIFKKITGITPLEYRNTYEKNIL